MRTDRTFVCTDCRVRCWPVRRCPSCGETQALVDLERRPDEITRAPRSIEGVSMAHALANAGGVGLVASVIPLLGGAFSLAGVGLAISMPLLLGGIALRPRGRDVNVPGERRYRVLDSPVVRRGADRSSVAGIVRAHATSKAPLSGRECVAWRLWAEGPHGALDDAMALPFAVVIGGGEPDLEVDASVASIDLPMPDGAPRPLPSPDPALASWLRARGVPDAGALEVWEAVLVDGDPVEVVGTARQENRTHGYRGTQTRDVLADWPGSPLIVRGPRSGRVPSSVSSA